MPLIVSVPGAEHAGERSDAVTELLDLYPSLADFAGLAADAPAILQGDSLLPLLRAPTSRAPLCGQRAGAELTGR